MSAERQTPIRLDDTDRKILSLLQQDATLSLDDIAAQVGASKTPVWNRIRKLREAGVIQAQVALLDPEALGLDAAIDGTRTEAAATWHGLDHLEGQQVSVVADGAPRGVATVSSGAIALDPPALSVAAGLAYAHLIEPLPPELLSQVGAKAAPLRLVSVTLRLLDTAALEVDLGRGPMNVPFRRLGPGLLDQAPQGFTGDRMLRALGWQRDAAVSLWRITGDTPLPVKILSVTTELRVND